MPTQQTPEQKAAAYSAAGVTPIAVAPLSTAQTPLNVSGPVTVQTPPVGAIAPTPTVKTDPTTVEKPNVFTSQLESLQAQLSGQKLDTAATKAEATAPYEKQLNDINTQIAQQQAKALANQEAALRSGETTGFASREAQNIARTDAIELLKLQALQAGAQGNITLAEKKAQSAIDTKYGQAEKDIETAKSNIYKNWDTFTAAEKKRAQATLLRLDKDDAFVKQQKEDARDVLDITLQAAQNGADAATMARLQNAETPEEALGYAAKALGAEFANKMQQQKFDNDIKTQQLRLQRDNLALEQSKLAYTKAKDAADKVSISNTGNLTGLLQSSTIGQGTKTQVANVLGVINSVQDLAKARPSGKFAGFSPVGGLSDNLSSKEAIENRGYLDAVNLKVQQWASGASLTKQQIDQVNRMTPTKFDTDRVIQTKLNNLSNFMYTQAQSQLQSEGITYVPEKIDLFVKNKSLDEILNPKP